MGLHASPFSQPRFRKRGKAILDFESLFMDRLGGGLGMRGRGSRRGYNYPVPVLNANDTREALLMNRRCPRRRKKPL